MRRSDRREPATLAKYLQYSHAGLEFFVAVGLFTWGGMWLDEKWNRSPIFTLIGLALGFSGGFLSLYRHLYGPLGRGRPRDDGRSRDSARAGGHDSDSPPADDD